MISREGVIEQSKGQNWAWVRSRFTTRSLDLKTPFDDREGYTRRVEKIRV